MYHTFHVPYDVTDFVQETEVSVVRRPSLSKFCVLLCLFTRRIMVNRRVIK